MGRPSRFSAKVRERAVRMVFEHRDEYESQWAAICSLAQKIGCSHETLRNWLLCRPRHNTHLVRNTFRLASRRNWDAMARGLRPVYTAPTEQAAKEPG